MMARMSVAEAYQYCVHVTRSQARNFYYGIRLLPTDRRCALCAVYALARRIDDIGDGPMPPVEKVRALEHAREGVRALESGVRAVRTGSGPARGAGFDPVLVALDDASARFPIPLEAFDDLLDGVESDVRASEYVRFDDLVVYCRQVAGSIGRLCLGAFDTDDREAAVPLADDLGVALQLTNILRDVVEDQRMGRVYLPVEDTERFGLDRRLQGPPGQLVELVRFQADRAEEWFDRGLRLLPLLDRTSAKCVGTMAGIYRQLLARIEEHPEKVLEGRLALPAWQKGWVAARHLAGMPRP